ncbi:MAG TPA: transglutaminase-like domain-containing protein [Candidatus Saccharicenans sp.]|nr:transglutaminase domain-containing protein [Candidatus Saccharicenans sp.]HRD01247.1 transglutaminase-like domain-containing protein [Candidatus Saccharicenans sp.]
MGKKLRGRSIFLIFVSVLTIIAIYGATTTCRQSKHFISDPAYRQLVHRQFEKRRAVAAGRKEVLFNVFKQPLSLEEKEALEFLYAFMPLSDLANLDGQYFLNQVRSTLAAREFFPWGKTIPEDIFRHFVLPYRVNNENPDEARQIFFQELKERVKNLDMYQAALEVNHWCHQKVTYRSTDERTSAPLATVKTAFGRCGEESTFTVTALRAVSLPARQVYTPRWAHTDDNHAWVEVWVNGRWHYLGACEPEPELNRGWFTGPASRAMMVHTTVYGQYQGPEEIITRSELFTRINQLAFYAPTTKIKVQIKDTDGQPVSGAKIDFCLYNYAEFYPLFSYLTNEKGEASMTTGSGDLFVWAEKDGRVAWSKVSVSQDGSPVLVLSSRNLDGEEADLYLIPPVARDVPPLAADKVEENNRRLQQEDAIRQAYEASFITEDKARQWAEEKSFPPGIAWVYLQKSRGNWPEIIKFLESLKPEEKDYGLILLGTITEKDLRDTPAEVLLHHLRFRPEKMAGLDDETYVRYVISPRIGRELLTPWRSALQQKFSQNQWEEFQANPWLIKNWIDKNIKPDDSNYYNVPLFPDRVLELGQADDYSRKILFVALARTAGCPAKINQISGQPAFLLGNDWPEIKPEEQGTKETASLRLAYQPVAGIKKPIYFTHFTLGRFDGHGYQTLDYENDPVFASFPAEVRLEAGQYSLVTGNRLSDGSVLCHLMFFKLQPEEKKEIKLNLREQVSPPQVVGQLLTNPEITRIEDKSQTDLKNLTAQNNFILLLIEPDREPTKHLMEELQAFSSSFSTWPGRLLLAVAKDRLPPGFQSTIYPGLLANSLIAYDFKNQLFSALGEALKITSAELPLVAAVRSNGEIIFYSEGYRIGLAEQLMKTLVYLNK